MDRIGFSEEGTPGEWLAVKTHNAPIDDVPAIYLVRDGRAAIVSYRHMLEDYTDLSPDLPALIRGTVWPDLSWTTHYRAWSPQERPNTLMLRYDEMCHDPRSACHKIAAFLRLDQIAAFEQKFEDLHRREPALFRVASNKRNIAEMQPHLALFDELHAPLMRELSYYP
jgi:hypothetical protein